MIDLLLVFIIIGIPLKIFVVFIFYHIILGLPTPKELNYRGEIDNRFIFIIKNYYKFFIIYILLFITAIYFVYKF